MDVVKTLQTTSVSVKQAMQPERSRMLIDKQQKRDHCGMQHPPRKFPAYGKSCNNCGKNNNYSRFVKVNEQQAK